MHCGVSEWYTSFSPQSSTPHLHWIYIPTSPPLLCSDWAHVLWWSMIKTPHHPLYVIYSSPLLIRNRSWCWPSLVPCIYCSACLDSAFSEMRRLKVFCCWTCYNSAVAIGRITIHPVQQTSNLCLTVLANQWFCDKLSADNCLDNDDLVS